MTDRGYYHFEDDAVAARKVVAFKHFGNGLCQLVRLCEERNWNRKTDVRHYRIAHPRLVYDRAVAKDDSGLLHTAHALGDSGRRETDPPAKLVKRYSAVFLKYS